MSSRFWIGLVILVAMCAPVLAYAQTESPAFTVKLQVPLPGVCGSSGQEECVVDETLFGRYLAAFFRYFYGVVGFLAASMIVFGGFRWITAAGNASKVSQGKEMIQSAIIGLVLALTSFVLLRAINPDLINLRIQKLDTVSRVLQGTSTDCDPTSPPFQQASAGKICGQPVTFVTQAGATVTCDSLWCADSKEACVNKDFVWQCLPVRNACFDANSSEECAEIDRSMAASGVSTMCHVGEFEPGSRACEPVALLTCDAGSSQVSCTYFDDGDTPCAQDGQPRSVVQTQRAYAMRCIDSHRAGLGFDAICCAQRNRQDVICSSRTPDSNEDDYVEVPCSEVVNTPNTTFRNAGGDDAEVDSCGDRCFIRLKLKR